MTAFEPNPQQRMRLDRILATHPRLKLRIEKSAVGEKEAVDQTYYLSPVSIGISSLTPFHESHAPSTSFTVDVVRLDKYMHKHNITKVNFLKIDTEGHDYFVLRSFPWDVCLPDVVECEFENKKTKKLLGYEWRDMATYLVERGYTVIVSEWFPIVRYGISHRWRCVKKFPCDLTDDDTAWGNLIAFQNTDLAQAFITISPPNNE